MRISRCEYVKGLRELADFLESHPDLPMPGTKTYSVEAWLHKLEPAAVAKNMGFCEKIYHDESIGLLRKFHGVGYQIKFSRNKVCKKVLVGYKSVTRYKTQYTPIQEMEAVYEWQCEEPIMKACEE